MESGGVIADVGHAETRPCRSEVNGYEIRAVCFNLPLIEYEDMRRIVGEAAQRYGYLYTSDPVPRDERHMRSGSSLVEWCNRFVSFGLGYALSWSGVSSC